MRLLRTTIGLVFLLPLLACGSGATGPTSPEPFALAGPHPTTFSETPDFVSFRPTNLEARPTWPAVVWYNGASGYQDDWNYNGMLQSLASWGFVVLGGKSAGRNPEETDLRTELMRRNAAPSDALYGKVDPERLGVSGHSLGAFEATIDAARFRAVAPIQGGLVSFGDVPAFYLTGANDTVILPEDVRASFEATGGPAWFAEHATADHVAPRLEGGPYRAPMIAFFRWRLADDPDAAVWFEDDTCTLCTSPDWAFARRN